MRMKRAIAALCAAASIGFSFSAWAQEVDADLIARAKAEGKVVYYTDLIVNQIVVPVATTIQARPRTDWATTLHWAIATLMVAAVGSLLFTLLGAAMIRAIQEPRAGRLRIAFYAVLSSVLALHLGMSFAWIVSLGPRQVWPFARSDWPRLLAASLLAPPLLLYAARESIARQRRRDPWGLDELAR